ncbi:MAG: substrate-binding domain-containing protein [Saccharofermentanales bacterium]|jgi:Ca-activated chloride channel family protein
MKKRILLLILGLVLILTGCFGKDSSDQRKSSDQGKSSNQGKSSYKTTEIGSGNKVLKIVSGSENKELEDIIREFADKNKAKIEMTYMGSIDIMRELQAETEYFDAVWPASNIWISMGDNSHRVKHIESTTITPVVFGIRKSLAEELGFVGKEVSIKDIMEAIENGKLKFCMTSATQSNSGASAYLGFLNALAGSPEVITEEHLKDETLQNNITKLLQGVDRSSGSSEWLKTLFLNGEYDAMVNYESLIITTNQELVSRGEEPLYVVYPYDGMSIADSPLGYIDTGNEKQEDLFLEFQKYITSDETQDKLQKLGRRTGYQGIFDNNKDVFNSDWGLDTEKVLSPIKTPKAEILNEALNLYQSDFRKPSLTIYCLDFSGSMSGTGEEQVKEAMDLILDQEKASSLYIQANLSEINHVIFFDDKVLDTAFAEDGSQESLAILNQIVQEQSIGGGTNMYRALDEALDILAEYDLSQYNPAIVLMTDGRSEEGFSDFMTKYDEFGQDIPVFSIMFGMSDADQLDEIAKYTNARVFDGREDLAGAFRSVKGYN